MRTPRTRTALSLQQWSTETRCAIGGIRAFAALLVHTQALTKLARRQSQKKMRVRATNYRSIWCRESRKQSKCARAHVVQGGRDGATCTSSSPARTTARQRASPRSRCRQMRCRKNKSWATSYREICREHDGAEYMVPAAVQEAARGRRQAAGGTKLSTEAARKKRTLCAAGELPSKCS